MPETKLKPCPFCGGKAKFQTVDKSMLYNRDLVWVFCSQCKAESNRFESNLYSSAVEDAAKAWNRRAENETD